MIQASRKEFDRRIGSTAFDQGREDVESAGLRAGSSLPGVGVAVQPAEVLDGVPADDVAATVNELQDDGAVNVTTKFDADGTFWITATMPKCP